MTAAVPGPGEWPVDPQENQTILDSRIWIDGCFDFFHHGHAGVMLQARQLGKELYVGLHSDEDILEHKGPTVMNLKERRVTHSAVSASDACRWVTRVIPYAPYVTDLAWISHYGCRYVVHGDDITSDSSGEDCYRFVKQAGRFKMVKRTPGISTTDLVGRMLLCTKNHFVKSLRSVLTGNEGPGSEEDRLKHAKAMTERVESYASDETGLSPGVDVWDVAELVPTSFTETKASFEFVRIFVGKQPRQSQRLVYVDGGFDLFSSGHIEFLRSVVTFEEDKARKSGWYSDSQRAWRKSEHGEDFPPCYVVAGIHNDGVINENKGLNYPIMNIYERGLCLLQCKYVHSTVFGAPFQPTEGFLRKIPYGIPAIVYHGPTAYIPLDYDPYQDARRLGIFEAIPRHDFQDVNAGQIVDRITQSRAMFEERQRKKGVKSVVEEAAKSREMGMTGP